MLQICICIYVHVYICILKEKEKDKKTHLPFSSSFSLFFPSLFVHDEVSKKKMHTMSITWKLNRFEDDEVMPTNSRRMCMCVSATLENSSGILCWFLCFIGSCHTTVWKKIKEKKNEEKRTEKMCRIAKRITCARSILYTKYIIFDDQLYVLATFWHRYCTRDAYAHKRVELICKRIHTDRMCAGKKEEEEKIGIYSRHLIITTTIGIAAAATTTWKIILVESIFINWYKIRTSIFNLKTNNCSDVMPDRSASSVYCYYIINIIVVQLLV